MEDFDCNKDGKVTQDDVECKKMMIEVEASNRKSIAQKRMAWVSLLSIVMITCLLCSPLVTDSRVDGLAELMGLFYVSLAGVVATYFGTQAWISTKKDQ